MRESSGSPCATCGRCCRSYVVSLLGYDVWQITRTLGLSPELFVLAHDQPEPADDGFLLEPDGWPQGLALDKRGPFAPAQPCVFLMELGGGHARCGIYENRPAICRTYPMAVRNRMTVLRNDALCPTGSWSEEEIGDRAWRTDLERYRKHWDEYVEVVDAWNRRVRGVEAGRFGFPEYLRYLLNTYDAIASSTRDTKGSGLRVPGTSVVRLA